ncbi:MAG: Sec-independent protein translocase protein TatB [Burkholderiales bacterium]
MLDIGISELFVIAVVALVVVGPERLPRVAKTAGVLFGRLQRYVTDVKADISREIELDELRRLQTTMQDAAKSVEQGIGGQVNFIESEVKQAGTEVEKELQSATSGFRGIPLMAAAQPASRVPETQPERTEGEMHDAIPSGEKKEEHQAESTASSRT